MKHDTPLLWKPKASRPIIPRASGLVYFTGDDFVRSDLDGGNAKVVFTAPSRKGGGFVAVDEQAGYVWWESFDTLFRGPLDGSASPTMLRALPDLCKGMVSHEGTLIITGRGSVRRSFYTCDYDGQNFTEDYVTDWRLLSPKIDPLTGLLWWGEGRYENFYTTFPAFTNEQQRFSGSPQINGLDIAPLEKEVYWTTGIHGAVRKANMDGTAAQTLYGSCLSTGGIALGDTYVFFQDESSQGLARAHRETGAYDQLTTDAPKGIYVLRE